MKNLFFIIKSIILTFIVHIACHETGQKISSVKGTRKSDVSIHNSAATSKLKVKYDDKGLSSILYQDHEFYAGAGAYNAAVFADFKTNLKRDTYRIGSPYPKKTEGTRNKIKRTYENGVSIISEYNFNGDILNITLVLENPQTNKDPIVNMELKLFKFNLPGGRPIAGTQVQRWSISGPIALKGLYDGAPPLIGVETQEVTLNFFANPELPATETMRIKHSQSKKGVTDCIFVVAVNKDAPLKSGEIRTRHFSIHFAPKGTNYLKLAKERKFFSKWRKKNPPVLRWQDRRAIGLEFLSLSGQLYNWPKNPRGWFNDSKLDITTEEGRVYFKKRLFDRAKRVTRNLAEANAQAVVIWDIEGQEAPHPISYVCAPNKLKDIAPEMDEVADEYIKQFTSAGFNVGFCIRPDEYIRNTQHKWGWERKKVIDPVKHMSNMISYVKKRWGEKANLFYLDSWSSVSVQEIKRLYENHPDILIIPEHASSDAWWSYGAIHRSRNNNVTGTPEAVKAAYPRSFSVNTMPYTYNGYKTLYDRMLNSVINGDILTFNSWWEAPERYSVMHLYTEAQYIKEKNSHTINKNSDIETLISATKSGRPSLRYAATSLLANMQKSQIAVKTCITLLKNDKNWVVAKKSAYCLGKLRDKLAIEALKEEVWIETHYERLFTDSSGVVGKYINPWYDNHSYVSTLALADMSASSELMNMIKKDNNPKPKGYEVHIIKEKTRYAIEALGILKDKSSISFLENIFYQFKVEIINKKNQQRWDHLTQTVRIEALQALANFSSSDKIKEIILNALNNHDKRVVLVAVKEAVKHNNKDIIIKIMHLYNSKKFNNLEKEGIANILWKITGNFKWGATAREWEKLLQ